jgi:hypothetical protein
MRQVPEYTSKHPFEADSRLDGLMLVCSDGRFESHLADFRKHLMDTMGLRRVDRYFVPGAQLQFASAAAGYPDADAATGFWARFLIDHHHIGTIVIIGHEQCAAYRLARRYESFDDDALRQQQCADLQLARAIIINECTDVNVYLYYMRPSADDAAVEFFSIE